MGKETGNKKIKREKRTIPQNNRQEGKGTDSTRISSGEKDNKGTRKRFHKLRTREKKGGVRSGEEEKFIIKWGGGSPQRKKKGEKYIIIEL